MNVILKSIGQETIQRNQVAAERYELSLKDLSVVLIPVTIQECAHEFSLQDSFVFVRTQSLD